MKTTINIRTILDDVIHQFSDPLAFFRELVQNSIDAGSGEIEIELSHDGDAKAPTTQISFRDWGEGMTREIIETKLVRLFSSGKDDDLTKIGRFGIGFVSVFAIDPEAVVVDTGRDGQYWRVLFAKDRSYELFALDEPVEGTLIRIFKPMERAAFEELKPRAQSAIVTWCKHAAVPIGFNGEDVRQDFDLPSRCKLTFEEQGTRVVMGFASAQNPFAGYYNRGLTLNESARSPWPWIAFKIDSRYLEHTLTRDQIIEDRHFEKALGLLRRLALEAMPERLIDALEGLAARAELDADYEILCGYLVHYLVHGQRFLRAWRRRKLFKAANGQAHSLVEVQRAHKRGLLYLTGEAGALAAAFTDEHMVLLDGQGTSCRALLEKLLEQPVQVLEERYCLPSTLPAAPAQKTAALERAIRVVLSRANMAIDTILFVNFDPLSAQLQRWPGLVIATSHKPVRIDGCTRPDLSQLKAGQTLLVNTSTQGIDRLCA
ncbi:MAG: ATP-binding protein, partial [Bradymonadaceae bacterium]|nr:ATP-binding protein [Lujinxingiaceae bacterium]